MLLSTSKDGNSVSPDDKFIKENLRISKCLQFFASNKSNLVSQMDDMGDPDKKGR